MHLNLKGKLLSLNTPAVMGIVNYTEDSFYDGSRCISDKDLLSKVALMLQEGADIIDLGAVSTRPGATEMNEKSEFHKIKSALEIIFEFYPNAVISVDTWHSSVAEMAISEGAAMINDISGGTFDDNMFSIIAKYHVPYCLMHTSAKPQIMQQMTSYQNIIAEMLQFFGRQIDVLKSLGVNDIVLDPGFGFGKSLEQNYFLMNNLQAFTTLNLPLLVGISRKSMIYKLLEVSPVDALNGTTVLNTVALMKGATILRVHDVKAAKEAVALTEKLKEQLHP
jgi:dihydropteroate synthase